MKKRNKRIKKIRRVREKIFGTKSRPRVSVFRSNRFLYTQVIDDENSNTIASIDTRINHQKKKLTKTERARQSGQELAKKMIEKKIKKAVFDRGPYKYGGRVKAFVEGLKEGGVKI